MCSCSWAPRSLCSLLFTALSVDSMLCLTWPGTGIWMPPCGKGWITLTNSFLKPNQLFLDGNLYIKPHLCKCHVCHPTGGCHHHIKGKTSPGPTENTSNWKGQPGLHRAQRKVFFIQGKLEKDIYNGFNCASLHSLLRERRYQLPYRI